HAGDYASLAADHLGELDDDMPARAADQGWVEHAARKPGMIPAMHFVAVHIDEVRLVVGTTEQDEDVVCFSRIVTRYAGGINAGSGLDSRRPQDGGAKT